MFNVAVLKMKDIKKYGLVSVIIFSTSQSKNTY